MTTRKQQYSPERLARNVRAGRDARGWGTRELADRVGISTSTVRDIELQRITPRMTTINRIAEILGCSEPVLMFGTDDEVRSLAHRKELAETWETLSAAAKETVTGALRPGGVGAPGLDDVLAAYDEAAGSARLRALAAVRKDLAGTP